MDSVIIFTIKFPLYYILTSFKKTQKFKTNYTKNKGLPRRILIKSS